MKTKFLRSLTFFPQQEFLLRVREVGFPRTSCAGRHPYTHMANGVHAAARLLGYNKTHRLVSSNRKMDTKNHFMSNRSTCEVSVRRSGLRLPALRSPDTVVRKANIALLQHSMRL